MSTESDPPQREPGSDDSAEPGDASFADTFNALSFDSGRRRRKKRLWGKSKPEEPDSEVDSAPVPPPPEPAAPEQPLPTPEPAAEQDSASIVRAYSWTRGRTRSQFSLQLETLVSTSDLGRQQLAQLREEHASVATLCQQSRSVAEIAALLSVPLGVARVLVGDMAEMGLVLVHQATSSGGENNLPGMDLMERVLIGLRNL